MKQEEIATQGVATVLEVIVKYILLTKGHDSEAVVKILVAQDNIKVDSK